MTYDHHAARFNSLLMLTVRAANNLVKASDNADGMPTDEWRTVAASLKRIAADADSLIDHGCTVEQMAALRSLYEGEKRAGLHGEHTAEGLEMRKQS